MKPVILLSVFGCLVVQFGSVFAGSIEAERYIGGQGIEIIHNRGVTITQEKSGAALVEGVNQKSPVRATSSVKNINLAMVADGTPQDSKLRISAQQQSERDLDRLSILNQELSSEATAFQVKWKALHAMNAKATLSPEQMAKLQHSVSEHEKNILALNAEIKRVKAVK